MKKGKKYSDSFKLIDRTKLYDPEEAVALVKQTAKAKFDETIEISVRLGVDPRHADQQVRGAVVLPHGTGRTVRVLVVTKGDKVKEAEAAGVKIVYVDSPANVPGEATFSTDNTAAGKTAGETMLDALTEKGVTSGKIGIVNVNAATASCVARESGFRSAFEGTGFELLETQYGEGDAVTDTGVSVLTK